MEKFINIKLREAFSYQRDNFDAFLEKIKFKYNVPSVHIAGTNGKGSTAIYLANIYKEAGYKVGLFTSPHLININESILINGEPIKDEDILAIVNNNKKLIEKFNLSSFEVLCFCAFTHFTNHKCDVAIIECGMGGEIDATNVFNPILSIITSVSLEHTSFLGKSLTEVALHKGGIIKYKIPLIIGDFANDATTTLLNIAQDLSAPVYSITSCSNLEINDSGIKFDYGRLYGIHLNTLFEYETINARYAIEGVDILKDKFPLSDEAIKQGLNKTNILCRGEIILKEPLVILDGAHNPEAMKSFKESMQKISKDKQIFVIFANFYDKNLIQILSEVGEITPNIIFTTFPSPRARKKEDYLLYEEYEYVDDFISRYHKIKNDYPESIIIFTGSLAFVGLVRHLLIG